MNTKLTPLQACKDLFAKTSLAVHIRSLDMQEILKFPFGLLLWALAERLGSLKKTKVASLPRQLYGNIGPIDSIIKEFAMIVDGMSFVQ